MKHNNVMLTSVSKSPYQKKLIALDEVWTLIKTNKLDSALTCLVNVERSCRNDQWYFSYSLCLKLKENYQGAIDAMSHVQNKSTTMLLHVSRCYEALHRYNDAIQQLQSIPHWQNDAKIWMNLGFCYEKSARFLDAITAFQASQKLKSSDRIKLVLAHCYQESGWINRALPLYHELLQKQKNDKKVLIGLARCYRKIGLFSKANQYYKQCPDWKNDREIQIGLGFCYIEMEDYDQAIASFQTIKHWEIDLDAISGLSISYRNKKMFDRALSILETYRGHVNACDSKIFIGLGRCHEALNANEQALYYYKLAYQRFPCLPEVVYSYCQYLLKTNQKGIISILNKALNAAPYRANLYLLKARFYIQKNEWVVAQAMLQRTIQQFPYFAPTYIALIHHYLSIGEDEKADLCYQSCLMQFPDNKRVLKQLNDLLQKKIFLQRWRATSLIEKKTVDLLPSVKKAFKLLNDLPGERYLVGSALHAVLDQRPLLAKQDIDIVMTADQLEPRGFIRSPVMPQLYSLKTDRLLIDCYVVPLSEDGLILSNAFTRDFTINCLYCDSQGTIFDPTGMGLKDYKNKVLQTVTHPKICFEEDPIRLLRAIKYILLGYTPVADLKQALEQWQLSSGFNRDHFYAVLRKQLITSDVAYGIDYVKKLAEYHLLSKVFNLSDTQDAAISLVALKKYLGVPFEMLSLSASHEKKAIEAETNQFSMTFFKKSPSEKVSCDKDSSLEQVVPAEVGIHDSHDKTTSSDTELDLCSDGDNQLKLDDEAVVHQRPTPSKVNNKTAIEFKKTKKNKQKSVIDPVIIDAVENKIADIAHLGADLLESNKFMSAWRAYSSIIHLYSTTFSPDVVQPLDNSLLKEYFLNAHISRQKIILNWLSIQIKSGLTTQIETLLSSARAEDFVSMSSCELTPISPDYILNELQLDFDVLSQYYALSDRMALYTLYCNFAYVLGVFNKTSEAVALLNQAISFNDMDPRAYFFLATIFKEQADHNENLMVDCSPQYAISLKKRTQVLFQNAKQYFYQSLKVSADDDPSRWVMHWKLAELAMSMHSSAEVDRHYFVLLNTVSGNEGSILLKIIRFKCEQDGVSKGIECCETFIQAFEKQPERFNQATKSEFDGIYNEIKSFQNMGLMFR